jgi:hypothetical protein
MRLVISGSRKASARRLTMTITPMTIPPINTQFVSLLACLARRVVVLRCLFAINRSLVKMKFNLPINFSQD